MGLVVVLLFLFLTLMGAPIFISLLVPSIIYILTMGIPISMIAQQITYSLNTFVLLAIPIFILVGSLLNSSGITNRIFDFANKLVGRFTGGLAQVNILTSLLMSGTSGSALADIGGIGRAQIYAMKENGYKGSYAAAVTAASSVVGPIFPPSVPLIMFGVISQTSVVSLLIGGIVPALICTLLLMVFTWFLVKRKNLDGTNKKLMESDISLSKAFIVALPAMLTPVILVFGMLGGYFSPTEAAVATVIYILFINIFIYRDFAWKHIVSSSIEAVNTSVNILFIVAAAAVFSWTLTMENVPEKIGGILEAVTLNDWMLLIFVTLIIFIIGMFLDTIAALFVVIPIFVPPLEAIGLDPVHIGLIIVFNLIIGLLTPPMGMGLLLSSAIAKEPMHEVLKETLPYFIPLIITLLLIMFVPSIVLWLPGLME
ncbi:TRAP transporter large permease [Salipaludibacillus sp. CF4.18]|uniref:TRAP transporter large permease n=1 Tax=Salipaludibacillus sp. CF4.18 TaxID=3373081 RepID=UPI003EE64B46